MISELALHASIVNRTYTNIKTYSGYICPNDDSVYSSLRPAVAKNATTRTITCSLSPCGIFMRGMRVHVSLVPRQFLRETGSCNVGYPDI